MTTETQPGGLWLNFYCGWDTFILTDWAIITYLQFLSNLLGIGISCICHNSLFNQIAHFRLINFISPKIFKKLGRSSNQEVCRPLVACSLFSGFISAPLCFLRNSLIDIMEFVESINNGFSGSRAVITLNGPLLHKAQIARIVIVFVILHSSPEPGQRGT